MFVAIHNLPLLLSYSTRAWLNSLPKNNIHDWDDLEEVFVKNFLGTYKRPESSWDLSLYVQNDGESFRDYIQWQTRMRNSMEDVMEVQAVQAFSQGVKYELLKHKLARANV